MLTHGIREKNQKSQIKNPIRINITYHKDINPIMIVKCHYSERSNSLRQQIRNGHLYRLLSKEGKHFEPHPSGAETNKYGRNDLLTIAGLPHHQLLAHKMFLSEPTHIHPFIFSCKRKIETNTSPCDGIVISEPNKGKGIQWTIAQGTQVQYMTDYKNELEDMYSTFFLSFHPEHTGIMELGKLYLLKDTTQMISVLLCLIN